MTIRQFAEKHTVTLKTIKGWMKKGYIPGAHDDYIPDSARKPYTATKARKGTDIIRSILKACDNHWSVFAAMYGISDAEFGNYIVSLLSAGLISDYQEDGITYYNITASGAAFLQTLQKRQKDAFDMLSKLLSAVKGIS